LDEEAGRVVQGDDMQVLDPVSVILKQKGGRIWSIHAGDTVYDAIALMADKQIGALLVMENSRLLGMLSERDYARKVILRGRSSKETRVDEIMSSDPATITPDCPIDDAMRMMTESRVRHLPVVDAHGTVVGIVSIGDLVKWIITSHQETIEQLQSYIAGTF
jgi:signal-transduction protein with cAMP-binding, CBS, and nucleotidyltransferase domain